MNPEAHSNSQRGATGSVLLVLTLCTLVAAGVRFADLDTRDFWYDESCSYIYVANLFDWPADSNLLTESTNLPYYVLLRGWSALFGDSESAYRSLSALAATLTVPLVGLVAWRSAGRRAGMVAAALAALNPLHVYYAREARAYALWMLVLIVLLGLLFEAARRERARWWVAYSLVALFALPLHYYTLFWLPGSVLCVAVSNHRARTFKRWLATTLLIGVCFTPYFLVAVLPAAKGGGNVWLAESWEPTSALGHSLWAMLPAGAYPAHLHGLSLASRETVTVGSTGLIALARTAPAVILPIALVMVVSGLCFRRHSAKLSADSEVSVVAPAPAKFGIHLLLAGVTLGPLLGAWVYSVAVKPIYFVGRYDVVAWPAAAVWMAVLIAQAVELRFPRRAGAGAAVVTAALLACSLLPLARMHAQQPALSLPRGRAEFLAQECAPEDLVIAFSYDRAGLLYYLHRAGFTGEIVSFPSWLDTQVGWVDTEADLARLAAEEFEQAHLLRSEPRALARADSPGSRPSRPQSNHYPRTKDALTPEVERLLTKCRARHARGQQVFLLTDYHAWNHEGPRHAVNRHLLDALAAEGYEAMPAFPEAKIWRLERGTAPAGQGASSAGGGVTP